ncbi:MAG: DUF2865 domain-containing protein [Rhodomicrobium sp.]
MKVRFRTLSVFCAVAAIAAAGLHGAGAEGWGWDSTYSRGSEPPPSYGQQPVYGQQPAYGQSGYGAQRSQVPVSQRCRDLELQLTGGAPNSGDQLPRIEADMRQAEANYRRVEADAEHANCYEDMFLFGRSLRRTPRCIDLDKQVQAAKSNLGQLKAQREAALRASSPRARHADLIAELARNRCGDQYVREYEAQRSRNSSIFSFFSDEEPEDSSRYNPTYGASTYRTLCVRECDGFYFPISTATSESQFAEDDAKCHSQCAAPAELYYHRVDQDVDQMVSLRGLPYAQMPNAFRNRKVYIRGCSCNATEFSREEIAKSEEALRTAKRADAAAGNKAQADSAFARRISQAVQNAPSQPPSAPAASAAPVAPPPAGAPGPASEPAPASAPAAETPAPAEHSAH